MDSLQTNKEIMNHPDQSQRSEEKQDWKDAYSYGFEAAKEIHIKLIESLRSELAKKDELIAVRESERHHWCELYNQERKLVYKKDEELEQTIDGNNRKDLHNFSLQARLEAKNEEIQQLKAKEIRGDRMIVDLEHDKMVLKSEIKQLKEVLSRVSECNDLATAREYAREARKLLEK